MLRKLADKGNSIVTMQVTIDAATIVQSVEKHPSILLVRT
jgi:hypothetical protein